jgi:hypothetical protein
MVYVYAGLGIAMLSGIMAIFEMGIALTGQSLWPAPADSYFTSGAGSRDKAYLSILNNGSWDSDYKDNDIPITCSNLVLPDGVPAWNSGPWNSSCEADVLYSNARRHRMIVEISDGQDSAPYQLYSCFLDGQSNCSFE